MSTTKQQGAHPFEQGCFTTFIRAIHELNPIVTRGERPVAIRAKFIKSYAFNVHH